MFKHIVLLKKSPWFIYTASEEDAIKTGVLFKENMVGIVVHKPNSLEVMKPEMKFTLHPLEIKEISVDPEQQMPLFDSTEEEVIEVLKEVDEAMNSKDLEESKDAAQK